MPRQGELEIPEGLQEFLQSFVVCILRNKPDDLLEWFGVWCTVNAIIKIK